MGFHFLSDQLISRMSKMLNEETTADAISFLPSHVGSRKLTHHLQKLAITKLDWGLEVQEAEEGYTVSIEDGTVYKVPREHWDAFQKIFDCELKTGTFRVPQMLEEAEAESKVEVDMKGLRSEVKEALEHFFSHGEFGRARVLIDHWVQMWPVNKKLTREQENISVSYDHQQKDMQRLFEELMQEYGQDRGTLELILEDLRAGKTPSSFEGFKNYEFLYGTRMLSSFQGQDVVFEVLIDTAETAYVTVEVLKDDLADKVEENTPNAKRVGNVFYPDFQNIGSFIRQVKASVEDLDIESEERE